MHLNSPASTLLSFFKVDVAQYRTVVPNVKNPPKHKFAQGDFTSFSMEVSLNSHNFRLRVPEFQIQNLSNRYRHKNDLLISRIFQILCLTGFCNLAQLCSKGKGRARREHLRMTACVSAAWSQSVSRGGCTALFRLARSAEQRGARRASVCLQRREESIYCWKEEGRTPLWFDKQNNIQNFLKQLLVLHV